jgi:hypothetical protein
MFCYWRPLAKICDFCYWRLLVKKINAVLLEATCKDCVVLLEATGKNL